MTSAIEMMDVMALLVFFPVCFVAKRHNVILELKSGNVKIFLLLNFFAKAFFFCC